MNELIFCLSLLTVGRVDTVKLDTVKVDTIRKMENGTYETPHSALVKLDYWARKGKDCHIALASADQLVDQVTKAKIKSDSTIIKLSNEVYYLRQDVVLREKDHTKLKNDYNALVKDHYVLSDKYSSAVRKYNWLVGGLSAVAVILVSILI